MINSISLTQHIFRLVLALFMIYAGFSHLSFHRIAFQAQVPDWIPMSKDVVEILSGIVEMFLIAWALWSTGAWEVRRNSKN